MAAEMIRRTTVEKAVEFTEKIYITMKDDAGSEMGVSESFLNGYYRALKTIKEELGIKEDNQ